MPELNLYRKGLDESSIPFFMDQSLTEKPFKGVLSQQNLMYFCKPYAEKSLSPS